MGNGDKRLRAQKEALPATSSGACRANGPAQQAVRCSNQALKSPRTQGSDRTGVGILPTHLCLKPGDESTAKAQQMSAGKQSRATKSYRFPRIQSAFIRLNQRESVSYPTTKLFREESTDSAGRRRSGVAMWMLSISGGAQNEG